MWWPCDSRGKAFDDAEVDAALTRFVADLKGGDFVAVFVQIALPRLHDRLRPVRVDDAPGIEQLICTHLVNDSIVSSAQLQDSGA